MNYWKLRNKCDKNVRLVVTVGPAHSVGVVLNPGQSVIGKHQRTPSMDAQIRRGFVDLDKEFNNDSYELELGKVYSDEEMNQKKMDKAAKDAAQYVDKK